VILRHRLTFTCTLTGLLLALTACASSSQVGQAGAAIARIGAPPTSATPFQAIGYAEWTETEPSYRLYPGDVLDVSTVTAPELNRTVTVQPDGRVSLPLIAPVMVADRTSQEAQAMIAAAYGPVLIRPQVELTVKTASPLKIFVGGEVDRQGVYDMPGDINALQAVFMAGGFRTSAKAGQVVIIRRGPDGRAMMRTVNLAKAARDPSRRDAVPLRRFDIVFVPRSNVSEAGLFMQQYVRDLLPIQFSYAINGSTYAATK
jgi:polysaccharide export outer membrane protein